MRTSDIAYVPHGSVQMKRLPPLDEMTLQEITKHYLTTCIKSHGLVSECVKCKEKCAYGKRAVSMALGDRQLDDCQIPYEGSLLQQARTINELKRKQQNLLNETGEEQKMDEPEMPEQEKPKRKRKNAEPEGWFEEAWKSGDPAKYVMERFNRSKTQAKKKLYNYKYLHPELREIEEKYAHKSRPDIKVDKESVAACEEAVCGTETPKFGETKTSGDDLVSKMMEQKLEKLMNQQEEYEGLIKEYQTKLTKVKEQIDTICKTMDILKIV